MSKAREVTAKTVRTIAWQVGNRIVKPTRAEIQRYGIERLTAEKQSEGLVTDLVTRADTGSEQYIVERLLGIDPDLLLLVKRAEEDTDKALLQQ